MRTVNRHSGDHAVSVGMSGRSTLSCFTVDIGTICLVLGPRDTRGDHYDRSVFVLTSCGRVGWLYLSEMEDAA